MNMIRKSGSTCRLTFETAESSGVVVVRAGVKGGLRLGPSSGLMSRHAAGVLAEMALAEFVIRCPTTVYNFRYNDSNAVFTLPSYRLRLQLRQATIENAAN